MHDVGFGHVASNNFDLLVEASQIEWNVEDAQDVSSNHARGRGAATTVRRPLLNTEQLVISEERT